ncbi:Rv2231c family pyridoxal phosphate-dependent protein CobC [Ammonicoccus fulvus]|uniref:Aminotransferase n=1 Tax=Ammonicoccus fulvus TaxID=3138240 RepID=A0ABZ3FWI1_9ACTN
MVDAADPDLTFHGDRELGAGLVDLAVNVRLSEPPQWLAEELKAAIAGLGAYPDDREATAALADFHGVPPEMVLPTAGGAEAFTLIARAGLGRRPCVVHPQFTEPEAALVTAGLRPERLVLTEGSGFRLDASQVPPGVDLVLVGNPTNPTGVLHNVSELWDLWREGRTIVVDEAFMDAVPGEIESMIGSRMPDALVLRSLTKTWGLAGLRVGYVVGDPGLIARLRQQQPPWSVSTLALAAIRAVCSERGRDEAGAAANAYSVPRDRLETGLGRLGLAPAGPSYAPFVLAKGPVGLREALRDRGYAVRRGDTFPGLGPEWIRIAVRGVDVVDAFLGAAADALAQLPTGSGTHHPVDPGPGTHS